MGQAIYKTFRKCSPEVAPAVSETDDQKFENYSTKKTIAKGMLDLGLIASNASQMRSVISLGSGQEFYHLNMVLLSLSIFLQVIVGLVLVQIGWRKYKDAAANNTTYQAEWWNHVSIAIILMILVVNVFIVSFGIEE